MGIHQLVHTLNYGDAISGEAITLKRILANHGHGGEIIAVHAHEKVSTEQRPLADLERSGDGYLSDAGIILHYSIASPLNQLFLSLNHAFRIVIYHNLTPEHWYHGYNARVVEDLRKAKRDLELVIEAADLVIADSDFNRSELLGLGCQSATVLPLLIDSAKWSVEANPGIIGVVRGHGGRNFLHVGRTAPNKCIEDVIKTFYFYHHKIDKSSRLWLVGSDTDNEIYSFELRRLVSELMLTEAVNFVGETSPW